MQSIDNTRTVVESSVNARLEDQTANLNRCLFFITPLISYATPPSSPRSPPFYSEFRLDCRELDYTCVCACTLVMHTCLHPCLSVYLVSVSIRSSLCREFVKASSLPLLAFIPFFVDSTMILFCSLSMYCYLGMHRKSPVHVYPLHVVVYLLDQFTLGILFRRTKSQAWKDTHTHT